MEPIGSLAHSQPIATDAPQRQHPIRVGILLDDLSPERWIENALRELRDSASLELVPILIDGSIEVKSRKTRRTNASPLVRALIVLDRKFTDRSRDLTASLAVEAREYGSNLHVLNNSPEENIVKLKALQLDVIVNFASDGTALRALGDEHASASVSKQGMWNFEDYKGVRIGPLSESHAGLEDDHVAFTAIRAVLGPNRERVVSEACVAMPSTSPTRRANALLSRRPQLLVHTLLSGSSEANAVDCPVQHPVADSGWSLRVAGRGICEKASRAIKRVLGREQWCFGVRHVDNSRPLGDMRGFRELRPPLDRFYADPFVFEDNGTHYIFFEEYPFETGKGIISCVALDGAGHFGEPAVVLEREYHLSYPFVFRHGRDIFMMPESSAAGRIEVYKAIEFPYKWRFHAVLIESVTAYDPTLLAFGGKYWLFVSGGKGGIGENDELSIYWADDLFGKWYPHRANPVVLDVRRARPAGAVFRHKGVLYRPGQDCSYSYGGAVTLNRIDELTTTRYREVPAVHIEPDWLPNGNGAHTFNRNERYEVIDGRRFVPAWNRAGRRTL